MSGAAAAASRSPLTSASRRRITSPRHVAACHWCVGDAAVALLEPPPAQGGSTRRRHPVRPAPAQRAPTAGPQAWRTATATTRVRVAAGRSRRRAGATLWIGLRVRGPVQSRRRTRAAWRAASVRWRPRGASREGWQCRCPAALGGDTAALRRSQRVPPTGPAAGTVVRVCPRSTSTRVPGSPWSGSPLTRDGLSGTRVPAALVQESR